MGQVRSAVWLISCAAKGPLRSIATTDRPIGFPTLFKTIVGGKLDAKTRQAVSRPNSDQQKRSGQSAKLPS